MKLFQDLWSDPAEDMLAMAFKITDEQFGQLTYTRIYRGTLNKGETVYNTRTGKKVRSGRMVRMNSNDRENIDSAHAGDIIAIVGIDCASGDTFVGDDNNKPNLSDFNLDSIDGIRKEFLGE